MEEKNTNKKTFLIIEITFLSLFMLAFIACIIMQFAASDLVISKWIEENIWDISETLISVKTHIPVIINCLIYIVLVYAVCRIIRIIFKAKMKKSNRGKTIFALLDGFVKYACAITIIILILKACGVDTTALIASVGVLTLVVGLGCGRVVTNDSVAFGG
jgi:small-conductance mechanosensitive channel